MSQEEVEALLRTWIRVANRPGKEQASTKMHTGFVDKLQRRTLRFSELEQVIWLAALETFRHLMAELLERLDAFLQDSREAHRYELKERNPCTVQTLVGDVTFRRRSSWDRREPRWVSLLDEVLGLNPGERGSPGLVRLAVLWATEGPSFRDARDRLAALYGAQVLSHEGIRRVLHEVSEAVAAERENARRRSEGNRRLPVVFIEVDGVNSSLQRPRRGGRCGVAGGTG